MYMSCVQQNFAGNVRMSNSASRRELLEELRRKVHAFAGAAIVCSDADAEISTRLPQGPFDSLLPKNFGERGTLLEWLAEGAGEGALWLACKLAAESLQSSEALVVVDPSGEFYPPVMAGLGVQLNRL